MSQLKLFLLLSCVVLYASSRKYGLIANDDQPLHLLDLKTKALVEGPYAEVEYIQTYNNPHDVALETEFYFPRTEESVFYKFEATFRNQTIVGHIHEKEKAKEMYEWNKERGNTVAYSERNALAPDIMQIKVGNIPPHESVEIKFSVIQPLQVIVNKFWGFTLPSVVTQRYAPSSVNPNEIPNIQNVKAKDSSYNEWKIEVEVKSDTPFSYIFNPSHNFNPELSDSASGTTSKIYKAKWNVTIVPNKNFVVYFRPEDLEEPNTILAVHPIFKDDYVLLTNFIPELNELSTKAAQRTLETSKEGLKELKGILLNEDIQNAKGEFIFVIDRSGSMMGQRIENLKEALVQFIQTLPKDSFFNIISFGSSYSLYKSESVKYTPSSLKEAIEWISSIDANMGGTEILESLKHVSSIPLSEGYPRTVMVLTDGDVFNPNEVINHVRLSSNKTRFCGVGIGEGASEYLIKNLAKAGRCTSQFVLDNEKIAEKTIYMIKAAISRYIEDINFKIDCFNDNQEQIFSQEEKMGILLKDQPFKKWVYIQNITGIRSCKIKVDYYNSMKKERCQKDFDIEEFYAAERTETWHKVAYDAKIKELDIQVKSIEHDSKNTGELKSEIAALSIKYQVMSDYTAFLAVLQENVVDPETGRLKITIPNIDSADYDAKGVQEEADNFGDVMFSMASHNSHRRGLASMKMAVMPQAAHTFASVDQDAGMERMMGAAPSSGIYDSAAEFVGSSVDIGAGQEMDNATPSPDLIQNKDEAEVPLTNRESDNTSTVQKNLPDSQLDTKEEVKEQINEAVKEVVHGHLPLNINDQTQSLNLMTLIGVLGAIIGVLILYIVKTNKTKVQMKQQAEKKD